MLERSLGSPIGILSLTDCILHWANNLFRIYFLICSPTTNVRFQGKSDITFTVRLVTSGNVTSSNLPSRRPNAGVYRDKHKHIFSLTEVHLIIQKRGNLYEGIEALWSLTKNSKGLASCHKTRTGFRG
jgi:hypothetical protein